MVKTLLCWGMLVGIVAGLLAFGFGKIFGESQIDRAITFEDQMDRAKGEPPGPELVSREVQSGVGLLTGVVVYGTALGGLFSLAFAYAYRRVGPASPRVTAALLAGAGFVSLCSRSPVEIPSQPAIGWPARDYRVPKRVVLFNDPDVGHRFSLRSYDCSQPRCTVRRVECRTPRGSRICWHRCDRSTPFA